MKPNLFLMALLLIPAATSMSLAQTALTGANCQTLTAENMTACCNAPNWRDIIPGDIQASCPSGSLQKSQQPSEGIVGSGTSPDDTGSVTPSPAEATGNNPGNASQVGGSGEKGMNSESPSTGTKGSSN